MGKLDHKNFQVVAASSTFPTTIVVLETSLDYASILVEKDTKNFMSNSCFAKKKSAEILAKLLFFELYWSSGEFKALAKIHPDFFRAAKVNKETGNNEVSKLFDKDRAVADRFSLAGERLRWFLPHTKKGASFYWLFNTSWWT